MGFSAIDCLPALSRGAGGGTLTFFCRAEFLYSFFSAMSPACHYFCRLASIFLTLISRLYCCWQSPGQVYEIKKASNEEIESRTDALRLCLDAI